jgi:hypothetical protein
LAGRLLRVGRALAPCWPGACSVLAGHLVVCVAVQLFHDGLPLYLILPYVLICEDF